MTPKKRSTACKYLHLREYGDFLVDKKGRAYGIRITSIDRITEIQSLSPFELGEMQACIDFDKFDRIPDRFRRLLAHIAYLENRK